MTMNEHRVAIGLTKGRLCHLRVNVQRSFAYAWQKLLTLRIALTFYPEI